MFSELKLVPVSAKNESNLASSYNTMHDKALAKFRPGCDGI